MEKKANHTDSAIFHKKNEKKTYFHPDRNFDIFMHYLFLCFISKGHVKQTPEPKSFVANTQIHHLALRLSRPN